MIFIVTQSRFFCKGLFMSKLYFLDQAGSRILSCRPDGSELRTVVADCTRHPDGIAIDDQTSYLYWTNMGSDFKQADGSIERARLDGSERHTIVAEGLTFTPKQILIDKATRWLYWCDREGMRVMRSRLDGRGIEVLVQTGTGEAQRLDARNWCVGIALDTARGQLYWTQKGPPGAGAGRILRAPLALPAGATPSSRGDIELLFDGLPEPVDLEWTPAGELLWTDRAAAPHGGSVQRAGVADAPGRIPQLLAADLGEAIGIAVDGAAGRMFVATLQGNVFAMNLDGSGRRAIVRGAGRLTGICYHGGYD
jgi:sugar lactone lactonase YvrE